MWTAFLNLLWHALRNTISEKGTTVLAFGIGIAASVIQLLVRMWSERKQGVRAMLVKLRLEVIYRSCYHGPGLGGHLHLHDS